MPHRAQPMPLSFWCLTALLTAIGLGSATSLRAEEEIGVQVPPGFTVTRYADDRLAHDIFSMTVDSLGRVVVSGPGYVNILIDTDGDGVADKAERFVDGPKTGAQGMYFLGRDLICTGDAGLIRYRDANGDDKADGPPELFLKLETGGEHNAHAVRRGPDGWWYVIAGNTTEVSEKYATLPSSPIKYPFNGTILRLKPDLTGGEVIADGFRNAYDFDFDAHGELYAYDSDDERDIALPFYWPTRLFQVTRGGEHGWMSQAWRRPDYMFDAAPVASATGRGSPTGVACYRHTQFPEAYRGNMFVLDWTFGRVISIPLRPDGAALTGTPTDFMTAKGQYGFAPTDLEVGLDGSLFVTVGGRGTHGSVYRIVYTGTGAEKAPPPAPWSVPADTAPEAELLQACLTAPQPSSSWSRVRWVPLAQKLGAKPFLHAALDDLQPTDSRVRAIEILTDLFDGLPGTAAEIVSSARPWEVRARAIWSIGTKPALGLKPQTLAPFLDDVHPVVRRRAVEALLTSGVDPEPLMAGLARRMNDDQRLVRVAAARVVPSLDIPCFRALSNAARQLGWRAAVTNAFGFVWRSQAQGQAFNAYGIDIGRRVLEGQYPPELKLEAIRLIQLSLADMGENDKFDPVFDGFVSVEDPKTHDKELKPLLPILAKLFPSGDRLMDLELSRLIALLAPADAELLAKVLAQITNDSHPVDDIHYLIVAARIPQKRSPEQQAVIARALVHLQQKLDARKLQQDNNWNERIGELYTQLVKLDAKLPGLIVDQASFGHPSHVIFLSKITRDQLSKAVAAFAKAATRPDYPWNNDVVFVFGFIRNEENLNVVRQQFEKFELQMAALMVLAEKPEEQDRPRFITGLDLGALEILTTCVTALEQLEPSKDPNELVTLVKLLRRLGADSSEYPLRERVVKLLERNTGENFGFIFGEAGYNAQSQAVQDWTNWVTKTYPTEAASVLGGGEEDLESLKALLAKVDWDSGDAVRGQKLYTARGCAQCHGGSNGLGPALSGVAGRFSREDLFVAIALPNRDVSPRYQTLLVESKAGKVYTGLIVYESVDGLLLRNGTNQTFRIDTPDIESKRNLPTSLMPGGLLKDLTPGDLADLYRYMQSLNSRTAQVDDELQKE